MGHLTKSAPSDKRRFELEWHLPLQVGLATHVALVDLEKEPPIALAVGHGADEPEALLDLWTTLSDQNDAEGAISRRSPSGVMLRASQGRPRYAGRPTIS